MSDERICPHDDELHASALLPVAELGELLEPASAEIDAEELAALHEAIAEGGVETVRVFAHAEAGTVTYAIVVHEEE